MDHPDNYDALIDALFEGRATPEEAARLLGDTAGDELEELAEIVDTLSRIDPSLRTPSESQFRSARKAVLDRIVAAEGPAPGRFSRWLPLAAALAAFVVGLAVGRSGAGPAETLTLTDLVERGALQTAAGMGTPFSYSNLRLRELDDGNLAMSVDVAAELDLVRPKNDLLVNDILASSLVNDASLGARLKAVRYAGAGPHVRQALIAAALDDPNFSVRLRALERLIERSAHAAETQEALLAVIANEESVAMRLLALEAIDDDYIGTDLIEFLDNETTEDGEAAVLWYARQRLDRHSL
ncbi:MAG: hypothetical protein O7A04_03810 [Acidobacteria bacterium]|nr:hypothetical protein [Acidobacteriota bacterium]